MPRAKLEDLRGYLTTSSVAEALGLSAYLIKARIADGTLPPPTRTSESGVLLFDDEWMVAAREQIAARPLRRRRREARTVSSSVPSPSRALGHTPGEAGWIPDWKTMVGYFETLAESSPRVEVEVLGESTNGEPYIVVAISAPENLQPSARQRNADILGRLWDSRGMEEREVRAILDEARSVGVILATQHSTEIGAALMTMQLAYEMVMAEDAATLNTLQNTITLLVPSHNPDGINMISEWYTTWSGTEHVGADLPFLYHPYTGHDNNRDWFMMTQAETRLYVDLHNREHPQAVFDMHQMGRKGARFMVPPFIDPLDPNQDPLIQQGFATLGSHIAQRLTAAGKAGVVTNEIFDNYSPSLAYGNYHGSVDLLSEAASVKLATPVTIKEEEIEPQDGFDPKKRAWNHPLPWKGGEWTLADIVEYDLISARAFLEHLAVFRRQWVEDYYRINKRTRTRDEKPFGFVIPPAQRDRGSAAELLEILQRGLVEVSEATEEVVIDGVRWPAGTRVVTLDQPAGAFAKTLLEVQEYPDVRKWKDGPHVAPYDIVGHTLPLQMGVRVVPIEKPLPRNLSLQVLDAPIAYRGTITGEAENARAWMLDERSNASVAAVTDLLSEQIPVYRARDAKPELGIRTGSIIVPAHGERQQLIREIVEGTGTDAVALTDAVEISVVRQNPVRLGVYQPWTASMDEGWARWVLEEFAVEYTTLRTPDIRQGGLRERFDVILVPHMSPDHLREGQPEKGREGDPNVPEYIGGLGVLGMDELRVFVETGGTVVGIDAATTPIMEDLALPVRNGLEDLKTSEFSCPGSLLRVVVDPSHPLGYGLPRELAVLFMDSVAYELQGGEATSVARYPASNPNLSGWILGEKHLEGKSALVDVPYGTGHVVLVGFRPYFRAQTRGTYKVLFNAIARAGYTEETLSL